MVAQKSEMSSIPDILTTTAPFLTLALCRVRQKLRALTKMPPAGKWRRHQGTLAGSIRSASPQPRFAKSIELKSGGQVSRMKALP
jgi:hypothetical protein